MFKDFQKTLTSSVSFEGIGLHSGKKSRVDILPGESNSGIIFKRVDLKENNQVEANFSNVSSAQLCTTLENEHGIKVSTVEHLLAAFYISGIDNAVVEINCEEVPIMDGSAKFFLEVLKKTELKSLNKKRRYLKILKNIKMNEGSKKISIEPNESFEVDFELNYDNKIIGKQRNLIDFDSYDLDDVSNSRTFCLFEDIEKIKKLGLAKGGSLDNAIVVDKSKILNKGGLRNKKEFVNHKILDLAGDFMLSGYRTLGKVVCHQGGHQLTNTFLKKIFQSETCFQISTLNEYKVSKKTTNIIPERIVVNA